MDFQKAKPQRNEWWIVALYSSTDRSVQQIDYISTDYVAFHANHLSVHKDHIDWIKLLDLWDDSKSKLVKRRS